MKSKLNYRSLIVAIIMAFLFLASAPAILTQSHMAQAKSVSLKLNKTAVTVKVGKKTKVKATCKKKVKFSLTDTSVAKIKKSGKKVTITGKKDGVTALIAKCGSKQVVCRVTVGKGCPYASISSKTKKALKLNAAQELVSYLKKRKGKAITLKSGNTSNQSQHYNDSSMGYYWVSSDTTQYKFYAKKSNFILEVNNVVKTHHAKYTDPNTQKEATCDIDDTVTYVSTLTFPADGTKTGTYKYSTKQHTYNFTRGMYVDTTYTGSTSFKLSSFKIGTKLNWEESETGTDSDNYEYQKNADGTYVKDVYGNYVKVYDDCTYKTTETYNSFARSSSSVARMLNCLNAILVDNNTGFTIKDLGAKYTPTHVGIGIMTSAELKNYAKQKEAERKFNETSAYLNRTDATSSSTTYSSGSKNGQTVTEGETTAYTNGLPSSKTESSSGYDYDSDNNAYANTETTDYVYDGNGDVLKKTTVKTGTETYGTYKGQTYKSETVTEYSYNAERRVETEKNTVTKTYEQLGKSETRVQLRKYTYDAGGRQYTIYSEGTYTYLDASSSYSLYEYTVDTANRRLYKTKSHTYSKDATGVTTAETTKEITRDAAFRPTKIVYKTIEDSDTYGYTEERTNYREISGGIYYDRTRTYLSGISETDTEIRYYPDYEYDDD